MNSIHILEGVNLSYPINLDIEGKVCVVLGGGHVAFRKITGLLNANGKVIVIAPEICEEIKRLVENEQIEWRQQKYSSGCLPDGLILIAATNDSEVNQLAMIEASSKNMFVNLVNVKAQMSNVKTFTVPSVIRKNNLMLTISTEGLSPALSKCIRQYLETKFNDNFARWLERLSKIREEVKFLINDAGTREKFWRDVMSNENFSLAQNGEIDKAEVNIRNALDSYRSKPQNSTD